MSKRGWETYKNRVLKMFADISEMKKRAWKGRTEHQILNWDSRDTTSHFENESADHIFTSPPYLNNFDYADRTRLEMYYPDGRINWKNWRVNWI